MRSAIVSIMIAGVLLAAGCSRTLSDVTTEAANWQYVREAWGGLHLGEPAIADDTVDIPLVLEAEKAIRIDSAICACGVSTSIEENRVLIAIHKCVCGSADEGELMASIPRPPQGDYEIVYNDAAAGYPHLGAMRVP